MSNNPAHAVQKARHRADPPPTDPANVVPFDSLFPPLAPAEPLTRRELRAQEAEAKRKQHHKAATLATGSFLVVSAAGGALGLQQLAAPLAKNEPSTDTSMIPTIQQPIVAAADVLVAFDAPKVGTVAAPPPPPPVVAAKPAPAPAAVVRVDAATPAPPPPPATPVGTKAARIAQAALNQVGVFQDCTMLVTNSLKAVGISFHDWPRGYFSLGPTVPFSEAVPGDLIWYDDGGSASLPGWDHIAVYIGNGKAVHGGFNSNQTVIFSMNVGSGPGAFIRVA